MYFYESVKRENKDIIQEFRAIDKVVVKVLVHVKPNL